MMGSYCFLCSFIGLISRYTIEKEGNVWEVRLDFVANIPQYFANLYVFSLFICIPNETAGRGTNLHIHFAGLDFDNRLSYFDPAALGDQPLIDTD
jgi:hypothetical protein